jgi:hypothetical protein
MIEWLQWLAYGGGFVALFVMFAEKWPWFQGLAPELKEIVSNVFVALGVAGIGLVLYFVSPDGLAQGDVYLNVFAAIVYAITGKEILYKNTYKK